MASSKAAFRSSTSRRVDTEDSKPDDILLLDDVDAVGVGKLEWPGLPGVGISDCRGWRGVCMMTTTVWLTYTVPGIGKKSLA